MSIKVAFHLQDLSTSNENLSTVRCAKLNRDVLKNDSALFIKSGQTGSIQEHSIWNHGLQIVQYSDYNHMQECLYQGRYRVLYQYSKSKEQLAVAVTNCVHSDPSIESFGNIFKTTAQVPLFISGDDNTDAARFNGEFIQPALKFIPTVGYQASNGTMAIFVGNQPVSNVLVFKTVNEMNSLDRLRETMTEIKSQKRVDTTKMSVRVQPLCNWTDSAQFCRDWNKMSENMNNQWTTKDGAVHIELSSEANPDYTVIINRPPSGVAFDPSKTIVFRMEPYIDSNAFYSDWVGDRTRFLWFLDHENFRNNTEHWISASPDALSQPIQKKQDGSIISTVVSSQYSMPGHRLRIDFVKYFQEHSSLEMDVWGYENKFAFRNYKGQLPQRTKDAGLLPYKYHFIAENSDIKNYVTEKFNDAIIAESLLFYWGCSNVEEHIDPRAFIRLDLENKEASLKMIEDAIANDEWSKRIDIIRQEKHKLLYAYNFFPRVCSLLYMNNINFVAMQIPGFQFTPVPGLKISSKPLSTQIPGTAVQQLLRNFIDNKVELAQLGRLYDHQSIWRECLANNKITCVIEGQPKPLFVDRLSATLAMLPPEWEILFLSWNNHNGVNNAGAERLIVTPLLPFINATQVKSVKELGHGQIGTGYVLHPRGAKHLADIVESYGFFTPLDEFFMMVQPTGVSSQQFSSFITMHDIVEPKAYPNLNVCHIFHKTNGLLTNAPIKFTIPPMLSRVETQLISDTDFQKIQAETSTQ